MDISVGEGYFIVFQFRYSRISSPKKHKNRNASSLHGKRLLTSVRVTNSSQSYKFYIFFQMLAVGSITFVHISNSWGTNSLNMNVVTTPTSTPHSNRV